MVSLSVSLDPILNTNRYCVVCRKKIIVISFSSGLEGHAFLSLNIHVFI